MSKMALKMLGFFAASSYIAWILLFVSLGQRRESRRRGEREHTRTTGTIVDYVRQESPGGKGGARAYWRPVVEFTAEGEHFRLEYEDAMNPERFPAGETVDILYDVSDPSRFHLEADPVFISGGGGAIRVSVIWILISAALTVALAVFVGGARIDLRHVADGLRRFFRLRR